jgi:chromosomal replication initiation ATPase DnaA
VALDFACTKEFIIVKGRKKNKAREVAMYLARDMSGVSCKDLGLYFGGVSGALITIMHKRIVEESSQNRRLRHRLDGIKKRIFNI